VKTNTSIITPFTVVCQLSQVAQLVVDSVANFETIIRICLGV